MDAITYHRPPRIASPRDSGKLAVGARRYPAMLIVSLVSVLILAAAHIFTVRLKFLNVIPRSRWLSFAGGTAAAYVVLHILPELAAHQDAVAENLGQPVAEIALYGLALLGLVVFYGLERAAKRAGSGRSRGGGQDSPNSMFWIHIGSFGLYNAVIGYLLLHREEPGLWPLIIYVLAMTLHFVTNDYGLRQHHHRRYDSIGRWILAAAAVAGWFAGVVIDLPPEVIAAPFAFLAGAILLNVFKEELPEERESRLWPFVGGSAVTALLLAAS